VRTVVELHRGQHLYILVGQEGSSGCEVGLVCQQRSYSTGSQNIIPSVLICHLSRLYVLVVMSNFFLSHMRLWQVSHDSVVITPNVVLGRKFHY